MDILSFNAYNCGEIFVNTGGDKEVSQSGGMLGWAWSGEHR